MNESFFRNPFDIESITGNQQESQVTANASSLAGSNESKENSTGNSASATLHKDR